MRAGSVVVNGALLLLCLLFSVQAMAAGAAARVVQIAGTVAVKTAEGGVKLLAMNSELNAGDLVNTQKGSSVRLRFSDGSELALRENTQLRVESYQFEEGKPAEDGFVYNVLKGGLRAISGAIGKRGNQDAYKAKVNSATIGIRGTRFGLFLCRSEPENPEQDCKNLLKRPGKEPYPEGLYFEVTEGKILVTTPAGSREYSAVQFGFAEGGDGAPSLLDESPGLELILPSPLDSLTGGGGAFGGLGADRNAVCIIR